jgi:hypothetical protein
MRPRTNRYSEKHHGDAVTTRFLIHLMPADDPPTECDPWEIQWEVVFGRTLWG